MNWRYADETDLRAAWELFDRCAAAGEVLYRPFPTLDSFAAFFQRRPEPEVRPVLLAAEDGSGFASGCTVEGRDKAYLTTVMVRPEARGRGVGRGLVRALEGELLRTARQELQSFDVVFFNPMELAWVLPGTGGHDHPNAPGVDVAGMGYLFLKNCGYRDFAMQNSYHLGLAEYEYPPELAQRAAALRDRGIAIERYDPARHTGLSELFDDLGSEAWRRDIFANLARDGGGDPVLIVAREGRAMGFTGPLSVQPGGRGSFCGIGVHSECRGGGAGKVLFGALCNGLRELGASFMTLFTGETNPARNIYEAAGFSIVRTWADMRRPARLK